MYMERSCDSLLMCIVTTLTQGVQSGGGIGDILRKPTRNVCVCVCVCVGGGGGGVIQT